MLSVSYLFYNSIFITFLSGVCIVPAFTASEGGAVSFAPLLLLDLTGLNWG
jgi:hypothetical protein